MVSGLWFLNTLTFCKPLSDARRECAGSATGGPPIPISSYQVTLKVPIWLCRHALVAAIAKQNTLVLGLTAVEMDNCVNVAIVVNAYHRIEFISLICYHLPFIVQKLPLCWCFLEGKRPRFWDVYRTNLYLIVLDPNFKKRWNYFRQNDAGSWKLESES